MTLPALLVAALAGALVLIDVRSVSAQNNVNPATVALNAPLPVFVNNSRYQRVLPTGFQPGSRWRFTTWTAPSQIDWVGQIERVSGPWAYIRVTLNGNTTGRWYYIPAMPGSWEPQ